MTAYDERKRIGKQTVALSNPFSFFPGSLPKRQKQGKCPSLEMSDEPYYLADSFFFASLGYKRDGLKLYAGARINFLPTAWR